MVVTNYLLSGDPPSKGWTRSSGKDPFDCFPISGFFLLSALFHRHPGFLHWRGIAGPTTSKYAMPQVTYQQSSGKTSSMNVETHIFTGLFLQTFKICLTSLPLRSHELGMCLLSIQPLGGQSLNSFRKKKRDRPARVHCPFFFLSTSFYEDQDDELPHPQTQFSPKKRTRKTWPLAKHLKKNRGAAGTTPQATQKIMWRVRSFTSSGCSKGLAFFSGLRRGYTYFTCICMCINIYIYSFICLSQLQSWKFQKTTLHKN